MVIVFLFGFNFGGMAVCKVDSFLGLREFIMRNFLLTIQKLLYKPEPNVAFLSATNSSSTLN